jgi:hypothetical protein
MVMVLRLGHHGQERCDMPICGLKGKEAEWEREEGQIKRERKREG